MWPLYSYNQYICYIFSFQLFWDYTLKFQQFFACSSGQCCAVFCGVFMSAGCQVVWTRQDNAGQSGLQIQAFCNSFYFGIFCCCFSFLLIFEIQRTSLIWHKCFFLHFSLLLSLLVYLVFSYFIWSPLTIFFLLYQKAI